MLHVRDAVRCGVLLLATAVALPAAPPYQIVLRSRHAAVTPQRTQHETQTGGGSILVEQPEPNTIYFNMAGSAVVGSDHHRTAATLDFQLDQELEIIATRPNVRPPRIGMIGRVVGTLQVTHPGKCCKPCGMADQGPAGASLCLGETELLCVSVPTSGVICGQELSINHQVGPVECVGDVGCYHLNGTFRISATQGQGVFHRQFAVADFDPAPQLDAFWADALKPFRAVPRRDFGFQLVVRVVEDPAGPEVIPSKAKLTSSGRGER